TGGLRILRAAAAAVRIGTLVVNRDIDLLAVLAQTEGLELVPGEIFRMNRHNVVRLDPLLRLFAVHRSELTGPHAAAVFDALVTAGGGIGCEVGQTGRVPFRDHPAATGC